MCLVLVSSFQEAFDVSPFPFASFVYGAFSFLVLVFCLWESFLHLFLHHQLCSFPKKKKIFRSLTVQKTTELKSASAFPLLQMPAQDKAKAKNWQKLGNEICTVDPGQANCSALVTFSFAPPNTHIYVGTTMAIT